MKYNDIRPSRAIKDDLGNLIQAHGGSILKIGSTYYWYGENKEGIYGVYHKNKKYKPWHHGIKLYSSKDLYNWKYEGYVMKESNDPSSPFYSENIMDRPHIIYNKKNDEYVLWAKCSITPNNWKCVFAICKGKSLLNMKYCFLADFGKYYAADFDLFMHDNKAYIIFANDRLVLAELNEDYDGITKVIGEHVVEPYPPYVREAPAFFSHNDRLFLLTSGTTGYFPNPSIVYDITDLYGEWIDLGNPCVNDIDHNSFHSQFSSVFYDEDSNTYIALGDNWLIDFDSNYINIEEVFKHNYSNGKEKGIKITHEQFKHCSKQEMFNASYNWLPISFSKNGDPEIHNQKSWKIR